MNAPVRTFLPWYRAGFATALGAPPPAGSGRAAVPAAIRLRGESGLGHFDVPLALAGPGDVIGLDPREVLRTEPFDGSADFESSYFPYVELASPDLPWRFSPEGPASAPLAAPPGGPAAGVQQRVRPWLALVVVPAERATLGAAPRGATPVLRCPAEELPDPAECWAWAHVQVTHDPAQSVSDALLIDGRAVARLLCPRRLEPGVKYLACVVPTFAAGRAALLGSSASDPLAPAWSGSGDVELPAYAHWTFRTGPDGSFEALVRRLRPRPVPAGAGGRTVATGAPGWGAVAQAPTANVAMQGALRPVTLSEPDADDPVLAESLRAAVSRTGANLQLRPPLYGQHYQRGVAELPAGAGGWLAQLNTDPRRRVAAGLASWAIAVNQEDLADHAWQQLAVGSALGGRRQVDPMLADAVTGSLVDRHQMDAPVVPALARQLRAGGPLAVGAPTAALAPAVAAPVTAATDDASNANGGAELVAPHFDQPGYELLRAVAPEWLLPDIGELPMDSVALAQTNGAFVESFMVGLNDALGRELVWRRFPLRTDGTFFDRFWASSGEDGAGRLPPIAEWHADDALGSHATTEDQLVLLVRGALLRRFPNTSVYLSRTSPAGGEEQLLPAFSGRISADCVFVGFPLTAEQATAPGAGWLVVVQEALGHARFGSDDPPADGGATSLESWQDLDWAHPQLAGHTHVPVAGTLVGVSRPLSKGSATSAVWGLDAANLAAIVQQPAFRVRIPIALWLSPGNPSLA